MKLDTSMSFRVTILKRCCLVACFLSLIATSVALGQAANSPVAFVNEEAITTSFVPATNLGTSSSGGGTPGQWLKVEFHYGTTANLTTKYLDAVQFKIWIEGLDLLAKNAPVPGKGVAVALTGSVDYINVPAGKDLYGVFYVHPNTLGRYSDDRGAENFDRKYNIHLEAYVNGQLMDHFDKRKDPMGDDWFTKLVPIPNLVYRQDQSPFFLNDVDRYPAIKLANPAAQ